MMTNTATYGIYFGRLIRLDIDVSGGKFQKKFPSQSAKAFCGGLQPSLAHITTMLSLNFSVLAKGSYTPERENTTLDHLFGMIIIHDLLSANI